MSTGKNSAGRFFWFLDKGPLWTMDKQATRPRNSRPLGCNPRKRHDLRLFSTANLWNHFEDLQNRPNRAKAVCNGDWWSQHIYQNSDDWWSLLLFAVWFLAVDKVQTRPPPLIAKHRPQILVGCCWLMLHRVNLFVGPTPITSDIAKTETQMISAGWGPTVLFVGLETPWNPVRYVYHKS